MKLRRIKFYFEYFIKFLRKVYGSKTVIFFTITFIHIGIMNTYFHKII